MMDRERDRRGPVYLWQGAAIFFIAAALGLLVNQIRSGPLPLSGRRASESPQVHESETKGVVSLDEALRLFRSGSALFLDARSKGLYLEGHIPGARNLPWESFDRSVFQVTADIPQDGVIITYCDGRNCPLSGKLTSALLDMGFRNVRTLAEGWNRWREEDLPSEAGPGPGES